MDELPFAIDPSIQKMQEASFGSFCGGMVCLLQGFAGC
jgi:hypothetical protein